MMRHTYNGLPMPYQVSPLTPYGFWNITQTIFYKSRSLQLSNDVIHLHRPINVPTKFNFLHFSASREKSPWQDFKTQSHFGRVKGQIKDQIITWQTCSGYEMSLQIYNFLHLGLNIYNSNNIYIRSRSLRQGQNLNKGYIMWVTCSWPMALSTSYTLKFLRYSPDKLLKFKVTTVGSKQKTKVTPWHCPPITTNLRSIIHFWVTTAKFKTRSHNDIAYTHHNQYP